MTTKLILSSFLVVILQVFPIKGWQCPTSSFCGRCTAKYSNEPDYYWKDYTGAIPEDALTGGTDESGNPTYIGQAYIKEYELLPVTIYRGCKMARTSAYNKELHVDKNIKILCVRDHAKYSWVATKNEETHLLTDCHLVVGGSEVGQTLNIGRVNYHQTIIGKVFSNPLPNRGLWIPYNGHEEHFLTYEILTYNCN